MSHASPYGIKSFAILGGAAAYMYFLQTSFPGPRGPKAFVPAEFADDLSKAQPGLDVNYYIRNDGKIFAKK